MIKFIKEDTVANTPNLEKIGSLISQMKSKLSMLSSTYANADDMSSRMSWNKKMINEYQKGFE